MTVGRASVPGSKKNSRAAGHVCAAVNATFSRAFLMLLLDTQATSSALDDGVRRSVRFQARFRLCGNVPCAGPPSLSERVCFGEPYCLVRVSRPRLLVATCGNSGLNSRIVSLDLESWVAFHPPTLRSSITRDLVHVEWSTPEPSSSRSAHRFNVPCGERTSSLMRDAFLAPSPRTCINVASSAVTTCSTEPSWSNSRWANAGPTPGKP